MLGKYRPPNVPSVLCAHAWSHTPRMGFCFLFLLGGRVLFHVTSISVFISSSFYSPVYHGKCTDSFVNNVGFAKKEKINEPF